MGSTVGAVLVFLIFVVATAEIALAIPIVLLLVTWLEQGAWIRLALPALPLALLAPLLAQQPD